MLGRCWLPAAAAGGPAPLAAGRPAPTASAPTAGAAQRRQGPAGCGWPLQPQPTCRLAAKAVWCAAAARPQEAGLAELAGEQVHHLDLLARHLQPMAATEWPTQQEQQRGLAGSGQQGAGRQQGPAVLKQRPKHQQPAPQHTQGPLQLPAQQHGQLQRPALGPEQGRARQHEMALCALLSCSQEALAGVTAREQQLLSTPMEQLQAASAAVAAALGAPPQRLAALLRAQPRLLLLPSDSVPGRLRAAAEVLSAPVPRLCRLVQAQPLLLLLAPDTLAGRLAALADALQLSAGAAAALVRGKPELLLSSPATLASKLELLRRSLRLSGPAAGRLACAAPALLTYSEATLGAKVAALEQALGCRPGALRGTVLEEPALLTRSPRDIGQKLRALGQLTGLGRRAVLDMVRARPALLTRSAQQVARSYRALSVWRLPPAYKAELLAAHPSLLRLSPAEVHFRCRWLRALMLRNAMFHTSLRRMPPALLGVVVLHLPAAWQRLTYLAEASRERELRLLDAVQLGEAAFERRFPEYTKWKSWGDSQGEVCIAPWRVELAAQRQRRRPLKQRLSGVAVHRRRKQQQQQQQQQQQRRRRPPATSGRPPHGAAAAAGPRPS